MRLDKIVILTGALTLALTVTGGCYFMEKKEAGAVGTVLKTVSGDRACYVDLKDAAGNTKTLLAEFDICHVSLTGKKIRYRMGDAKLIAPSCEGAPDCKNTVTERIIISAKVIE